MGLLVPAREVTRCLDAYSMIEALREAGYDDLGILDLAIVVADANNWARLHRLMGLSAELGQTR